MGLTLDPKSTGLVLIDLQNAIVSRQLAPNAASDVVSRSAKLAEAVRAAGGTVVYVHVLITDILSLPVDRANPRPPGPIPPEASELVPAAGFREGDALITKRQWGAFYGGRISNSSWCRRGIRTLSWRASQPTWVLNPTARAAHDQGYLNWCSRKTRCLR